MSTPRISVVIPTYNYGCYLRRAVESALAQIYPPFEIIVVDDGSTDDTRAVASSFGAQVRYIFQHNRGISCARNTGIGAATGDWIAFLDADDWWLPEKLQRQAEALAHDTEAALVYTAAWKVRPDGSQEYCPATAASRIWPQLRYNNCISNGSSAMVLRKALLAEGGFDETLKACEDWDMWFRLARKYKIAVVTAPVTAIAVWDESVSCDHQRMLTNTAKIIDKTLLSGLRGWRRSLWRRRIWSAQYFGASITARAGATSEERTLLLRSIFQWPSPAFLPDRWKALAISMTRARS
jgi:cellulose synthase/poly-beta-1,6-N-acetylglucosamine synthase-like glycosyltransferase